MAEAIDTIVGVDSHSKNIQLLFLAYSCNKATYGTKYIDLLHVYSKTYCSGH